MEIKKKQVEGRGIEIGLWLQSKSWLFDKWFIDVPVRTHHIDLLLSLSLDSN